MGLAHLSILLPTHLGLEPVLNHIAALLDRTQDHSRSPLRQ